MSREGHSLAARVLGEVVGQLGEKRVLVVGELLAVPWTEVERVLVGTYTRETETLFASSISLASLRASSTG